jgi:hypothetical protein
MRAQHAANGGGGVSWRKPLPRGLRHREELLVEVQATIVDATGTSLPGPGTPVTVGLTGERLLVWAKPAPFMRAGRLLGGVARARIESVAAERRAGRMSVHLTFEEGARLTIDAPAEAHPEQLVWVLTADEPQGEQ